ncbi:MAG: SUMF1/EgtB/PvdO family nonheme iron enzyme [Planctomycetota bacterium]
MRTSIAAVISVSFAGIAGAQAPPDYGFDFVTIGDVGNAAYNGFDGDGRIAGRGSVGYEYRISRTEIRTEQYLEFMNVLGRLDPLRAEFTAPTSWGAFGFIRGDGTVGFELDTGLADAADIPVYGIPWRNAALYVNWLHNDKAETREALNNGAYDASTFFTDPDNPPNLLDQTSRNPDARYWIPSLDEWLKAAHYDPNRNGVGEGGWWQYPNGTDEPLQEGLPGEPGAQTSYQLDLPNFDERSIPVGAYPDTQSPWGLLDVSGGATEWTETWLPDDRFQTDRVWMGSLAGPEPFAGSGVNQDILWRFGTERPNALAGFEGLRVASAIPGPASVSLLGIVVAAGGTRRRR